MWVNLDENDLKIFADIYNGGSIVRQREALKALHVRIEDCKARQAELTPYRDACSVSGDTMCDGDAVVSAGESPGAFVMTWTWVSNEEAGVETPEMEDEEL